MPELDWHEDDRFWGQTAPFQFPKRRGHQVRPQNLGSPAHKLTSPRVLRELLARHGIRLRTELGQHFLVDENILQKIVEATEPSGGELAVEVGAGVGTLTVALAPRVGRLWAVELDQHLIPLLGEQVADLRGVEVIHADFLRVPLADLGEGLLVTGNLPYGITSGVLLKLIRERRAVNRAVLLVQREVAEKLVAPPGPEASRLGVHLGAYFELELVRRVPRTAFFPSPEVDSALIRLSKLPQPRIAASEEAFEWALGLLFSARRKTIRRALASLLPLPEVDQLLARLGLDPKARGEALPLEEIDRLAQALLLRGQHQID